MYLMWYPAVCSVFYGLLQCCTKVHRYWTLAFFTIFFNGYSTDMSYKKHWKMVESFNTVVSIWIWNNSEISENYELQNWRNILKSKSTVKLPYCKLRNTFMYDSLVILWAHIWIKLNFWKIQYFPDTATALYTYCKIRI